MIDNSLYYRKHHKYKEYFDYYRIMHNIDEILASDYSVENWNYVDSILKQNKIYEDYFFYKLDNVIWFDKIKQKCYFAPEKALGPKSAEEQRAVFSPFWNVLPYLEKVSEKVSESGNWVIVCVVGGGGKRIRLSSS